MVDALTPIKHTEECWAYIWHTLNIVAVLLLLLFSLLKAFCCCYSVTQSCPTLCYPTDCITAGFLVFPYLLWFVQTHARWVRDAIQPPHPCHLLLRLQCCRKRPRCWERLRAGGEGDGRGWDGWMSSLTQWTWVVQTTGDSEGQEGLMCYHPWDHKESDTAEQHQVHL